MPKDEDNQSEESGGGISRRNFLKHFGWGALGALSFVSAKDILGYTDPVWKSIRDVRQAKFNPNLMNRLLRLPQSKNIIPELEKKLGSNLNKLNQALEGDRPEAAFAFDKGQALDFLDGNGNTVATLLAVPGGFETGKDLFNGSFACFQPVKKESNTIPIAIFQSPKSRRILFGIGGKERETEADFISSNQVEGAMERFREKYDLPAVRMEVNKNASGILTKQFSEAFGRKGKELASMWPKGLSATLGSSAVITGCSCSCSCSCTCTWTVIE